MPAIREAIEDGQETICCSCCVVDTPVDSGDVIRQSERISVRSSDLSDIARIHARLKEKEHAYYPLAIRDLCL
jgi:folate-dependent phosphoribosylglycinamide formyltransferase PurN